MSISQDSAATIVCREVFDETSHPTNEELLDYAKRLGIDPDAEPHLLDLAREGLMAALPKGWSPCFHEASGAWYYYQASTGTTTWEHPLDAVYRGLVEQARTGNKRQMSLEEDSKTTAKDLESHEDATLPKETLKETATLKETTKETNHPKPGMVGTKIPMKLAPLRKIEKIDGSRRRDRPSSFDRLQSRRESDSRSDNIISLSSDRAARDYTNLKFQDPKFYECPKLLEKTDTIAATTTTTTVPAKKELDLKEVLKRSESLSPWHEKDWEQLSSKFSSEENIIDIDKLSASTLARPEKSEKFDKEKHPSQLGQQKELTLSGGGSMFLKSNRSRDNTPSQDGGKLEDFQALMISDEINNAAGDRLKSILREKQLDDDDRPLDEERKSVRFDLEKEINFNFTYSESEDDWESESEDKNPQISAVISNKITGSILSSRKPTSQNSEDNNDDNKNDYPDEKDWDKMDSEINKQRLPLEKIESMSKNAKIVGKRFLVQNVSENEHHTQMTKNSLEIDNSLDYLPNKLSEKVKNIDLVSKSETDCSTAKSSDSDEIRRTRSIIEKARHVTNRLSNWQLEDDESSDMSKVSHHYAQKERFVRPKLEYSRSIDDIKVKMNREHEKELEAFKIELEVKLQEKKKELEENFAQQKLLIQQYLDQRLEEVKQEMAQKEEQEIQALIAEMDQARIENLKKVRTELEACYEKERQEILANLKTELDERKKELLELRNQEMGKLENEHERDLGEEKLAKLNEYELRKQQTESIEILKKELEKELEDLRNELRMQQREKITKFTEDHEQCLAEILRDFRMDEALARKMYKERLEEIRADFARETEKEARKQTERVLQDSIDFEKMRCEKRLLQDKYTALKEKYMKLKNDVRLAVERRSRRKEGYTTASETERSTSTRTKTDRTESSEQNTPLKNANSSPVTNAKSQEGQNTSEQVGEQNDPDNSRSQRAAAGFQKRVTAVADSKSAAKFESDDTTTASETNTNMMMMKKKKSFSKKVAPSAGRSNGGSNNNPVENPVENIRKQLKKLEDLGDQLPSNETAYTVRYPFQDKAPANASSELEFFRHRIHVERDSVRRAREALRQQRSAFQGRQRAWKQRSARATLEQLVQEERELSDMEVSLHRTRSLLGEKVIHLKHLEQSLERVANDKRNENDASSIKNDELTLSDMSSASSGFSSTDLGTDTFIDKPDHYQESTEIIASLENLNSEIREIWDVLNKRQDSSNIPPTPALMYSYLRWLRFHHLTAQPNSMQGAFGTPNIQSNILSQLTVAQPPTTTTQNIIAQYGPNSGFTTSVGTVERNASNLMERTRNLRDWLRQARVENTDLISPGQATL